MCMITLPTGDSLRNRLSRVDYDLGIVEAFSDIFSKIFSENKQIHPGGLAIVIIREIDDYCIKNSTIDRKKMYGFIDKFLTAITADKIFINETTAFVDTIAKGINIPRK